MLFIISIRCWRMSNNYNYCIIISSQQISHYEIGFRQNQHQWKGMSTGVPVVILLTRKLKYAVENHDAGDPHAEVQKFWIIHDITSRVNLMACVRTLHCAVCSTGLEKSLLSWFCTNVDLDSLECSCDARVWVITCHLFHSWHSRHSDKLQGYSEHKCPLHLCSIHDVILPDFAFKCIFFSLFWITFLTSWRNEFSAANSSTAERNICDGGCQVCPLAFRCTHWSPLPGFTTQNSKLFCIWDTVCVPVS